MPFHGEHWNGNGAQGFQFTSIGTWNNYDSNEFQILICPVPYSRDASNLAPIVARIVIDDYNEPSFAYAYLCGRAGTAGDQHCVSDDNFPTVFGNSTIELSLTPTSSDRFVWIEVHIPPDDNDNNPWTLDGTSGLVGYRIFRN